MLKVNTHIHTPYSFSSFDSVPQAVSLAAEEGIRVLGISDFNTIEGYEEFGKACADKHIFPLYNIEFIALSTEDQQQGKRWNDPQNPGVMYVCGKALAHPSVFSEDSRNRLRALWKGTQDQIWRVIQKLNDYLVSCTVPITLDYNAIRTRYARGTVRERHVARALLDALREFNRDPEELVGIIKAVYRDRLVSIDLDDDVGMQNQLRGKLLKAGAPAYVPEDQTAFLSVDQVRDIILDGGGIPCYPVLADDKAGMGEYESDPERLCEELQRRHFHVVEFIPSRNTFEHLLRYVRVLRANGFCVTFGTEHNTPDCPPLTVSARGGVAFDNELEAVAYEGACILAAHAALTAQGKVGFVDKRGCSRVAVDTMAEFARIGDQIIRSAVGQ